MDVTIGIASYGGHDWEKFAQERALPSAQAQASVIMHHEHGAHSTLAKARNHILNQCETEWIIFLDADDELEPDYVEQMETGVADVRAPSVRFIRLGGPNDEPFVPNVAGHTHTCVPDCLPMGNWLVVGSCAKTQLLRDVGGWWEEPVYEDWSLWLRCWKAGASIEAVPAAIYRAHRRLNSRNRAPDIHWRNQIHHQIVTSILG